MTLVRLDIFLWQSYLSISYTQAVFGFSLLRLKSGRRSQGEGAGEKQTQCETKINNAGVWSTSASHMGWIMHVHRSYLILSRYFWPVTNTFTYVCVCVCMYVCIPSRYIFFIYVHVYICTCMHLSKTMVSDKLKYLQPFVFWHNAHMHMLVHMLIVPHIGSYSCLLMGDEYWLSMVLQSKL